MVLVRSCAVFARMPATLCLPSLLFRLLCCFAFYASTLMVDNCLHYVAKALLSLWSIAIPPLSLQKLTMLACSSVILLLSGIAYRMLNPTSATCLTLGCTRLTWDGKVGYCCRTCKRHGGEQHGNFCDEWNGFHATKYLCCHKCGVWKHEAEVPPYLGGFCCDCMDEDEIYWEDCENRHLGCQRQAWNGCHGFYCCSCCGKSNGTAHHEYCQPMQLTFCSDPAHQFCRNPHTVCVYAWGARANLTAKFPKLPMRARRDHKRKRLDD